MSNTQHTYDSTLLLKAAALVAASAAGTLEIDTGGGWFQGDMVIDVTAIEVDTGNEAYTVVLQGSPDDAFTAATSVELVAKHLGDAATKLTDTNKDDTTGRYIVPFHNLDNGTYYRYLRIYTVVAGTIVTGINYSAFIGVRK